MGRVIRAERRGPSHVPAVVHDARREATEILARANEEAERVRLHAHAQGLQAGHAQAAKAAFDVAAAHARALDDAQRSVVEAVSLIARRLVGEAYTAEPERIAALAIPLLARVRRAREIVLHANPSDVETLRASVAACSNALRIDGTVEVRADPAIERGGCLVKSNLGELDARLEVRVAELTRALRQEPR